MSTTEKSVTCDINNFHRSRSGSITPGMGMVTGLLRRGLFSETEKRLRSQHNFLFVN